MRSSSTAGPPSPAAAAGWRAPRSWVRTVDWEQLNEAPSHVWGERRRAAPSYSTIRGIKKSKTTTTTTATTTQIIIIGNIIVVSGIGPTGPLPFYAISRVLSYTKTVCVTEQITATTARTRGTVSRTAGGRSSGSTACCLLLLSNPILTAAMSLTRASPASASTRRWAGWSARVGPVTGRRLPRSAGGMWCWTGQSASPVSRWPTAARRWTVIWTRGACWHPAETIRRWPFRLPDNATFIQVLVRALTDRYTVKLRDVDQSGDELSCPCQESNGAQIQPAVSGVRVCSCPEVHVQGKRELLVRAESDALISLSVAEVVALNAPDSDVDDCTLLGYPAHGRFEPFDSTRVKLSCDPGYGPSCSDAVQCSAVQSGKVRLSCLAASCPQPPAIPNTTITHQNGTSWRSVVEYSCRTGYVLCPADQNTTSSCDSAGLWSIGHISCLPDTDSRVLAMRLGQEHVRSMAALRSELLAVLRAELQAERNRMQERLSKLERGVALLGLAVESAGAEQQLEIRLPQAVAELAEQEAAAVKLERQLRTTTNPWELEGGAAELAQLSASWKNADVEVELHKRAYSQEITGYVHKSHLCLYLYIQYFKI